MNNFFQMFDMAAGEEAQEGGGLVAKCASCQLYKGCKTPKMPPDGQGKRKIFVLGEAPGRNEDEQGIPFIGESGQYLSKTFRKFGVEMRRDCRITNSAICRPPNNKFPPLAVEYCRPNMIKAVEEFKPEVVILLGAKAVQSLLGWLWKEDVGSVSRWDGWRIPSQRLNAWVCPTWHPQAILRTDYGQSQRENEVRAMFFEQHIQRAVALRGRPWKKVPDYDKQIRLILDPEEAAKQVRQFTNVERLVAFDYETNMLKPDSAKAQIVTCSLSDGLTTIAFPWQGAAIEAMEAFLSSPTPKVASNKKFEERWSRKVFKRSVRNWKLCTMNCAHVLDNRSSICSIKFQAFVLLGVDRWDLEVAPYLSAAGPNVENRIRECNLTKLLRYNAMDSLMELLVAQRQLKPKNWADLVESDN
jgi:uracil-DNA glycosylase family 4